MSKLSALLVLGCLLALATALPEARLQQRQLRQLQLQQQQQRLQHPYLFFSVPNGRANAGAVVKGFEIVEEPEDNENDDDGDDDELDMRRPLRRLANNDAEDDDDDSDEFADDDDDVAQLRGLSLARNGQFVVFNDNDADDDEQDDDDNDDDNDDDVQRPAVLRAKPVMAAALNLRKANQPMALGSGQALLKNAKATQMMVARDQAGAIMVPDGIIEIEGQSVVDEKTGKSALLVPRAALDAIPDGAVVALMERSASDAAIEEERANRIVTRRRIKGGRRNGQMQRRGVRPNQRRRRVARRPANNNRRRNVRVGRPSGNRRRGGVQRRRRAPIILQG